jgi:hypothetical protein
MFSALLYLQFVSLKNRLFMRFKRLKQPKYLLGPLWAGLIFTFTFSGGCSWGGGILDRAPCRYFKWIRR